MRWHSKNWYGDTARTDAVTQEELMRWHSKNWWGDTARTNEVTQQKQMRWHSKNWCGDTAKTDAVTQQEIDAETQQELQSDMLQKKQTQTTSKFGADYLLQNWESGVEMAGRKISRTHNDLWPTACLKNRLTWMISEDSTGPYRAVHTETVCYKNKSVNAVQWNNRCLFSDPH
jgi:hypothetical protein